MEKKITNENIKQKINKPPKNTRKWNIPNKNWKSQRNVTRNQRKNNDNGYENVYVHDKKYTKKPMKKEHTNSAMKN